MENSVWDEHYFTVEEKNNVAAILHTFFKKFLDNPFISDPIIQYGCKKEIDKIQLLIMGILHTLSIDLNLLSSYQISDVVFQNMNTKKKEIVLIILNEILDISEANALLSNTSYLTLIEVINQLKCRFTGSIESGFKFL